MPCSDNCGKRIAICVLALMLMTALPVSDVTALSRTCRLTDSPTAVSLIEQDRQGITVSLEIGKLMFTQVQTKGGSFVLLSADGLTRSHEVGEPNLPMANRLIAVPFGCELEATVIDYEIEEIDLSGIGITDPIIPVQPTLFKSLDPEAAPFRINRELYEREGFYSLPVVRATPMGTMRSLRLALVSLSPIEYNPTENMIRVLKRLDVSISYINPDWETTETIYRESYSPFFEPVYERVLNYDQSMFCSRDDLVEYPVKYVIVSDWIFQFTLQPFIEWKTKKGFEVITAYTNEIGTSFESIKTYLSDLYNSSPGAKPSFVLFVGDVDRIPSWTSGFHCTDLRLCEFTDDFFPEVYYGRFSADLGSHLIPQISKTLEYEKYEMPDPSYLGNVTMIAGVDEWYASTYGNGQINYGTNLYFNVLHGILSNTWLYPASADSSVSDAMIQTVNDGIGLINYTAHCSHDGFGNPVFNIDDINGLTNEHMYLLSIGNCCQSNDFSNPDNPCFGEEWLRAENKGGIGYIGASDGTAWDEDYWWSVGYGPIVAEGATYEETGLGAYDGVFHEHGEPESDHYVVNDAIIYCGNLAVTESGSYEQEYYWEIYHLMGDPSVLTYIGLPIVNTVQHADTVVMAKTVLTVAADPGSYVGVTMSGALCGAGYIDTSGYADINVSLGSEGTAEIVVTAQNRIPYFSTVHVIESEPYTCGDANSDGVVDIDDAVFLIGFIFLGGPPPEPYLSGDVNCTGQVDIDDIVYIITFIFQAGNEPCDVDGDGIPDC